MDGNIQARHILSMFMAYPEREWPEEDMMDPKKAKQDKKKPKKKKKVIELILKVKGKTIKDKAKIPTNVDIALSNIDLVIQEVLNKPTARIYA